MTRDYSKLQVPTTLSGGSTRHPTHLTSSLRRRSSIDLERAVPHQLLDESQLEEISLEDDGDNDVEQLEDEEMGKSQRRRRCCSGTAHISSKLAGLKAFSLWVLAGCLIAAAIVLALAATTHTSVMSVLEEHPEVVILPVSLAKVLGLVDACFTLMSSPPSNNNSSEEVEQHDETTAKNGGDDDDDATEQTGSESDAEDSLCDENDDGEMIL